MAWQWLAGKQKELAWAAVAAVVAASAWILIPRNRDWHDDVRLFTISSEQAPKSGTLVGNVQASERVEVRKEGKMVGDIKAPRVVIADGAKFKGNIEMGVD